MWTKPFVSSLRLRLSRSTLFPYTTLFRSSAACFDGFDYVALGHLHRPQTVGESRIRYSGSLLKYSLSEAGHEKSVSRSEEHTSELQSRPHLVCRLLLEKKYTLHSSPSLGK